MAIFDALIDDIGSRFGLGANAGPLVREVAVLVASQAGTKVAAITASGEDK